MRTERQSVPFRDQKGVLVVDIQVMFDETVRDHEDRCVTWEILRIFQQVNCGLQHGSATPLNHNPPCDILGRDVANVICICVTEDHAHERDIFGNRVARGSAERESKHFRGHGAGRVNDDTVGAAEFGNICGEQAGTGDVGCAALAPAGSCVGAFFLERREVDLKPLCEFHVPWDWRS